MHFWKIWKTLKYTTQKRLELVARISMYFQFQTPAGS